VVATPIDDVLDDLRLEYERIESILASLTAAQWTTPSAAEGWTIGDTVLHLAVTEEGVATTLADPDASWNHRDRPLDDVIDDQVRAIEASPTEIFDRWRAARRVSLRALATADPAVSVRWAAAPLRPRTLATTRLAEHWAHALDITEPLAIDYPDTDRLRHVAWLGHATLPYAMEIAGLEVVSVHCRLSAPSGSVHEYGPSDARAAIIGGMGAFCRVGARRLSALDSGLSAAGPGAADALRVLRNYAA
jgi:uncharacterized protein (TIGR03084 family)